MWILKVTNIHVVPLLSVCVASSREYRWLVDSAGQCVCSTNRNIQTMRLLSILDTHTVPTYIGSVAVIREKQIFTRTTNTHSP